jgi:FkbM family methyltransferase
MRIIFIFIKFIRFIFNSPLLAIIKIGSIYSYLLKFLDVRNHDTFWEENLQKEVEKKKSKKIFLDKKKFLRFYTPTLISAYRAKSFFTKEPDTLEWLDKKGGNNKILYDIGANMGIYSLYYSKKFNSTSYVFEPSFMNLNLIQNNLKLNNLEKKVVIVPNPTYSKTAISTLYQLRRIAGDAVTTLNNNKVFKNMLDRSTVTNSPSINQVLGLSIDYLVENKILKKPDLIKIDVDGNEIEVLKGCKKTLSGNKKISILIELRKDTYNSAKNFLKTNGLKFVSKMRNNYIWEK